eukprot:tig00020780_g13769.t1
MRRATSLAVAAPARIHATASVSRAALLKSGVHVGPWCNVGPGAVLEEGVKLKSHVSIRGPVWVGRDAVLFPHVRIEARGGGDPLRIGERTLVREHARILEDVHVGPGSLLLADCELRPRASVGKHVVLSNKTVIGESANVEDFVGIGGAGVIGDGVCVGKGSFVGGHSREEADVLPHSLSMASKPKGLNIVGLSRRGMSHQTLRLLEAQAAAAITSPPEKRLEHDEEEEEEEVYEELIEYVAEDEPEEDEYWADEDFDEDEDTPRKRGDQDHMFFDRSYINVKGGDGGNGCVAFLRLRETARGGPSGGTGGKGGDVIFEVDPGLNTLLKFRGQVHFRATSGKNGQGKHKAGSYGIDRIVRVPPGTVVRTSEGKLVVDLSGDRTRAVVARGGRGGRGNAAFKSTRNVAPRLAEKGEPGEERWLNLELKLIADVGLVGVPNAGKSTLLAALTAAKPKIADYPFTTITPNLGVARLNDGDETAVLVDVPGLLEGAHDGVGMGVQFLRHVERCRLILHLINGESEDPLGDFDAIRTELALFNPRIADKPAAAIFTKMDLPEAQARWPEVEAALNYQRIPCMAVSSATGDGLDKLLQRVSRVLKNVPREDILADEASELELEEAMAPSERRFTVTKVAEGEFVVEGTHIERVVKMTNWDYYQAIIRFQRILEATGISAQLRKLGVQNGDTVTIAGMDYDWEEDFDPSAVDTLK